jgi:NAD(P)-dependent dehydrogenase (short-subunit alcohol dehydrogenase family)
VNLDFEGRVAIVTGAGRGLGRQYALALAARGAKVVVNDLTGSLEAPSRNASTAQQVVSEIVSAGGHAIANSASVTDSDAVEKMVKEVMERWGRVDILINNAGVLRDKSFAKMSLEDFRLVLDVHLMGSVICTKAVWQIMQQQQYGRIMMTTSSSGLYGNFGQANYAAAKMALVGLMQTLAIEGSKYNIHVNSLAPTAATQMTEGLLQADLADILSPEAVVPAMLVLTHESAPTRAILCAGAGAFEAAYITLTDGVYVGTDGDAPERLARVLDKVTDRGGSTVPEAGSAQGHHEIEKALAARNR